MTPRTETHAFVAAAQVGATLEKIVDMAFDIPPDEEYHEGSFHVRAYSRGGRVQYRGAYMRYQAWSRL